MSDDKPFPELIRGLRAGDGEAAEELVRRYGPTIRRVARLRLTDTRLQRLFDSMDICQSVFRSFFVRMALGQFDLQTPEQLLKLLVDMSRKKVIDSAREAAAARRDYRRTQALAKDQLCAPPGSNPWQQVADRELLQEFFKRLSGEERQLAQHRSAGLDWAQIAALLGRGSEALRKKLRRAVDRVAREMGLEEFV